MRATAAQTIERTEWCAARARELLRGVGRVPLEALRERVTAVTIALDKAVLCESCRMVSDTLRDRCPVCDSAALLPLRQVLDGERKT